MAERIPTEDIEDLEDEDDGIDDEPGPWVVELVLGLSLREYWGREGSGL